MKLNQRRVRDKFNQVATFFIRNTQQPMMQKFNSGYITIFHDYEGTYALPGKADASFYGVKRILDVEKKYSIKATYNVVGRLFVDRPEIIERIINEGHDLASHSYDHKVMTHLTKKQMNDDVHQSKNIFREYGLKLRGFRSPQSRWNFALMQTFLKNGLEWSAENDNSDYPYVIFKKKGEKLIRLPIKMDDWDYVDRRISPEQMSRKLKILVKNIENQKCYGAIGFHPWVQGEVEERLFQYEKFLSWVKSNKGIQIVTFQDAFAKFKSNENLQK